MRNATDASRLTTVLFASGMILSLAMGVRHGFGFWLQPISQHHEWTRDTFSLAMALQNLMWGVFGPFAGMAADRFGAPRVVLLGALLYMAGLLAMSSASDPTLFAVSSGVLIGAGLACTAFGALSGVVGRTAPVARRSWAFGILGAAGSFGQFAMVPVEQMLIAGASWQGALHWLAAAVVLVMVPLSLLLREPALTTASGGASQSITEAVREAFAHLPFRLLVAGYFVCGFQVVFIGVHLPSYLKDRGVFVPFAGSGIFCVRVPSRIYRRTSTLLPERSRGVWSESRRDCACLDRLFQYLRLFHRWPARRQAVQAEITGGDLSRARIHHQRVCVRSADHDVGIHIRRGDGAALVIDRAADEWCDRRHVWRSSFVDAVRLCFFLTPARQLLGRLAGRLSLHGARQLRQAATTPYG